METSQCSTNNYIMYYFIMALQPFAGPSPLFKFLDPIYSR
jgi:hypothetical protein